jgi:hypothetical protein
MGPILRFYRIGGVPDLGSLSRNRNVYFVLAHRLPGSSIECTSSTFSGRSEMKTLLIGICLIVISVASGCTTTQVRDVAVQGVAVYPCTKNPLLRSAGLFGGAQPEIFLSGPDVRREPPPSADSLTRVLSATEVDSLGDPGAEPDIDKCSSWLRAIGEDEIELTIMWSDRNCTDSTDDEDHIDCRSRASFRFSRRDLGMEGVLDSVEDTSYAIQRLLIVDAYFTKEILPKGRHQRPACLVQKGARCTSWCG